MVSVFLDLKRAFETIDRARELKNCLVSVSGTQHLNGSTTNFKIDTKKKGHLMDKDQNWDHYYLFCILTP